MTEPRRLRFRAARLTPGGILLGAALVLACDNGGPTPSSGPPKDVTVQDLRPYMGRFWRESGYTLQEPDGKRMATPFDDLVLFDPEVYVRDEPI